MTVIHSGIHEAFAAEIGRKEVEIIRVPNTTGRLYSDFGHFIVRPTTNVFATWFGWLVYGRCASTEGRIKHGFSSVCACCVSDRVEHQDSIEKKLDTFLWNGSYMLTVAGLARVHQINHVFFRKAWTQSGLFRHYGADAHEVGTAEKIWQEKGYPGQFRQIFEPVLD